MKHFTFLAVAFLYAQAVFSAKIVEDDKGDHCDECTQYFDNVAKGSLREKVIMREPLTVRGIGHCKTCTFTGLHEIKRTADKPVCVSKKEDGTIVRHTSFEFRNFTIQCDCTHSHEPSQKIKDFSDFITNPMVTKCLPKRLKEMKPDIFPTKIDTQDAEDLQKCLPQFFNVFLRNKEMHDVKQYKIGAAAPNAKFFVDFVTKPGENQSWGENVQLVNEQPFEFSHLCEGPDSLLEACRCLMETKYLRHFYSELFKVVIPCFEYQVQHAVPECINEMACPVN